MWDLEAVVTAALLIGVSVLGLQIVDAVLSVVDARSVRDDDEPDRLTRGRVRELFWTVAVTAALAVMIAFAVDSAGRLVWEQNRPLIGGLVLLGSAVAAFGVGLIAVVAIVRRERPTYARIRRDLRDRSTSSLDADELRDFEDRLARADQLRTRRSRAGTLLRALAVVVVVVVGGLALTAVALAGDVRLVAGFAVSIGVSVVAFVVAVRAGSVRLTALDAVLDAQRAEVDAMLERARIPQRGKVPGLRDRVARALSILREQQR